MASALTVDYSLSMQAFDLRPAPLVEDEHGVIRVVGSRVQLESVVDAFDAGATPEEIVQDYPSLDLPAAYAIVAYVLQNRERVDVYVRKRHAAADALRHEIEQALPPDGLRDRLLRRRAGSAT
jgi:uncharacterized protein (DUF433 family)